MDIKDLKSLAKRIDKAAKDAAAIPQLTHDVPFDVADAYAIQAASIGRRLKRGERLVGYKMGFTSHAKMRQMGVHELIWGRLTDAMLVPDGGTFAMADKVHPRVEPEVAFLIGRPLAGPITPAAALAAVEAVAPAIEVIDSRFEHFRFSLADVVADNCSSSSFVVGPWAAPSTDLANRGVILEIDGRPVQVGSTAAILGHPLRSLVEAARLVGAAGATLEPGMVVLAGAATAAVYVKAGQAVRALVDGLGQVTVRVT